MSLLGLPAPYGWDSPNGAVVTLWAEQEVPQVALERVLLSYSCHPPAIPKIKTCLHHSGRYDCILQASWFRGQREEVTHDLAEIGVRLEFKRYTSEDYPWNG